MWFSPCAWQMRMIRFHDSHVRRRITGQREDAALQRAAQEDGPAVDRQLRALRRNLPHAKGHGMFRMVLCTAALHVELHRQVIQRRLELIPQQHTLA